MVNAGNAVHVGSQAPQMAEFDAKPWKYLGYRAFSKVIASDDDFLFLRRFGTLHSRVLLSQQDFLSELEERLESIDKNQARESVEDIHNGTFRDDEILVRSALIEDIGQRLKEYG